MALAVHGVAERQPGTSGSAKPTEPPMPGWPNASSEEDHAVAPAGPRRLSHDLTNPRPKAHAGEQHRIDGAGGTDGGQVADRRRVHQPHSPMFPAERSGAYMRARPRSQLVMPPWLGSTAA